MKKLIPLFLALICAIGLFGCSTYTGNASPVDSRKPTGNIWSGTISEIFTEEVNGVSVEVIKIEYKDNTPLYFAILEDTNYIKYSPAAGAYNAEIAKEDLYIGAYAEVYYGNDHPSEYHTAETIRLIEDPSVLQ